MSDAKQLPVQRVIPLGRKKGKLPVRPMSVAEQWQRIAGWQVCDGFSPSVELDDAWKRLEMTYGETLVPRGAKLSRLSDSPLAALFFLTEMGLYPPPELLLGLRECWTTYLNGAGEISLEEAFLGATTRRCAGCSWGPN